MDSVWNMYDQAMCDGEGCPIRWACRRFLAEPLGRQDYFGSAPFNSDGTCEHFLPIREILPKIISNEEIQTRAYFISQENLTHDQWIWKIAEMDYVLEKWTAGEFISESGLKYSHHIDYIKDHAYFKSLHGNISPDILHWQLAELMFIFHEIKSRILEKKKFLT